MIRLEKMRKGEQSDLPGGLYGRAGVLGANDKAVSLKAREILAAVHLAEELAQRQTEARQREGSDY
jgi:hypothetical protein